MDKIIGFRINKYIRKNGISSGTEILLETDDFNEVAQFMSDLYDEIINNDYLGIKVKSNRGVIREIDYYADMRFEKVLIRLREIKGE